MTSEMQIKNTKIGYNNYELAKLNLNRFINDKYNELIKNDDKNNYSIIDYIEDKEEKCMREIHFETENKEYCLNRYTILAIKIDDMEIKYDSEENFLIDNILAHRINNLIYKGIKVRYMQDTNTIIFNKLKKETEEDEEDLDCIIYRNYNENDIIKYIENQLKDYISEKEKNNKPLYHLHNDYGEYNEYTTDENKIIMIYIDELAQCVENNISMNIEEDEYKNANDWLYKIMMTCGAYSRNEIDINKIIEELNREHHWLIEICKKGDENYDK